MKRKLIPPQEPVKYRSALAGRLPAEALTPNDRRVLVRQLVTDGMSDLEIAAHTRWTLYTTSRIREDLWLAPNQPTTERAAA
ncbi:hypothetical protein O4215_20430 [Rhodococcus maanshanensis]|uniref:hypothetical protein n=1 Tax=Rhodococcus maanshanensis TaxID=183556 RepID=UPI0022B49492|nr:hypothetical protein [Rhodococcus maanshanensis]MCZ4557931.1 hypothetical protein [Rhodococcus maanshanensis]